LIADRSACQAQKIRWALTPGPNGTWTETVLHRFGESARDGTAPNYGALVLDAAENLYGTTLGGGSSNYGVAFEVKPESALQEESICF
jgi:uncharacterized repeat protein (TIGR03803 family)